MRARYHGEPVTEAEAKTFPRAVPGQAPKPTVGFMFKSLAGDPDKLLPVGQATIDALSALGRAMAEDSSSAETSIPAAFTYFGQFIDHDISKTVFDPSIQPIGQPDLIEASSFNPLSPADVVALVSNVRKPLLDLDSVYQGLALEATDPSGRMILGEVSAAPFGTIPTQDRLHDLPRRPIIANPQTVEEQEEDRRALIGDPRNDENLLVAQLHVAVLRAHNAVMSRFPDAASAQTQIRRRYQWAVLHDFLRKVCAADVVEDVLTNGARHWVVENPDEVFMPVEFSGAGYRFGHSMIRGEYDHNATFNPTQQPNLRATFNRLFTFTALSGDLQPGPGPDFEFPSLPDNWIIEWHRFFDAAGAPASANPARRIDSNLTPELGNLRDFQGMPITNIMAELAARNLLRGYLLGLPTGQAVADHLGVAKLNREVLQAAVPTALVDAVDAAGLFERTPLWFYILAESGDPAGADGQHLGAVGSRIVAETLWNLVRHSPDSVIADPPGEKELQSGEFSLKGLIALGLDAGISPIR